MGKGRKGMEIKDRIISWAQAHQEEFFEDLKLLVSVDSSKGEATEGKPFGQGCAQALKVAQDILSKAGFASENHENYVVTTDLNDGETVLGVLAHLDIVPTGDGWSFPPLDMRQDEEKVYGRGTADDKGPALAAFYAMRAVRELGLEVKKNCRLILGADEECGSSDIRHYFSTHPVPRYTLSPDADYPVINIEKGGLHADAAAQWEKEDVLPRIARIEAGIKVNVVPATAQALILGMEKAEVERYLSSAREKTGAAFTAEDAPGGVRIACKGENAHASTPEKGVNALTALLTLLAALPLEGKGAGIARGLTHIFPHGDFYGAGAGIAQEDRESGKLTIALTVLKMDEGGVRAQADCRAPLCATDENLTDVMRAKYASIGLAMDDNKMYPPHHVPKDSPLVLTLLSVYEDYTGEKGRCIAIGGGTYVHNLEGGVSFGAAFEGVNNNMHGPDEFAYKRHLLLTIMMYAQVIWELCKS